MISACANDDTLGPVVRGCRHDFDFTITFEHVFLSIVPAAIFTIVALARLSHLLRKQRVASGPVFQWLKLLFIAIYTGIRLWRLTLSSRGTPWSNGTASDIAAVVVGLVMLPLSFLEHARSTRPSVLLGIYLLVAIVFEVVHARTLWLLASYRLVRLSVASLVVKFLILVLESHAKTQAWHLARSQQTPEATSSIFGLVSFFWLNRLFIEGFRKILTVDDLFPLDDQMAAEALYARMEPHLEVNTRLGHKDALLRSLVRTLAVPLLLPIAPRFCRIGFHFCQPLLISSLLNYLQDFEDSSPSKGYAFIGIAIFIYVGKAVANSTYYYLHERFLSKMRGVLASAVYRKTTTLKLSAADDAAALTLMNADVERVRSGSLNLHEFWANTVEVIIACWMLQRQIGAAFVAPLFVVAVSLALSSLTVATTGVRQMAWMKATQKRIGVTSKVIASMKALKISAMSVPVEKAILGMRLDEINFGGKWRMMIVASVTISYMPTQLGPPLAFLTTYQNLDVTRIFTSFAYLLILAGPLGMLFQHIPIMVSAFTCLGRIQAYLEKEPRVDFRRQTPVKQNGAASAETEATAIAVRQGSFGWEEGKNILKGIDLRIPASSLTIIVGPIASGKSTLLKAILGETPYHSGEVIFGVNYRRIGYCDQSPFLYNDTVKANILGHSPLDPTRYNQVIDATMLSVDLAALPKGDGTAIGSNGVTLSGGQRQRVALARALYLETDLLVFDDILSGLDANTEAHVFRRVFGPDGMVRQRGVTAVLCTHSVRHLPAADHIVALGTDCTVVEEGSFAKLQTNGKYVQSLEIKEEEAAGSDKAGEPEYVALARTVTAATQTAKESDKTRQVGDLSVYKYYFGSISSWVIIVIIFWCCVSGFAVAFPSVWLKYWSEDLMLPNPTRSWAFWVGFYTLFQVFGLVSLAMIVLVFTQLMIRQSGATLHERALRTLVGAPLRFFTITDAGSLTTLFAQDVSMVDTELPFSMINFSIMFFSSLGMVAVITTSSPYLAITYPFLVAVLYAVQVFYLRTSRQLRMLDLEAKSPLYSHFTDTLKGLSTLRAQGFISSDIEVNNRLVNTSQRPSYQLALIQRWLGFTLQLVVASIAIIVVTLATQLKTNSGFAGASLVTFMSFSDTLTSLVQSYTGVETSFGAVARLKTFSSTVKPESGPDEDVIPQDTWPEKGTIELKDVSASYGVSGDSPDRTEPELALRSLNLTIRPGEKVAVCGRTGSGKSSLMLLLLRLLDPLPECAGGITIDARPINNMDRDALRRCLIAVSQDPIFLPDGSTVLDNIDPFGEAEETECRDVLEQVGLLRVVEDRGGLRAAFAADSLSAGQKQLFCLARAVLRRRVRSLRGADGGVLLLDEVSSSVDRGTELQMHAIIDKEFVGYTVVMVSHRLDMTTGCDTVIVMDKGRVAEKGEPGALKEKEGGMFRELWEKSRTSEK